MHVRPALMYSSLGECSVWSSSGVGVASVPVICNCCPVAAHMAAESGYWGSMLGPYRAAHVHRGRTMLVRWISESTSSYLLEVFVLNILHRRSHCLAIAAIRSRSKTGLHTVVPGKTSLPDEDVCGSSQNITPVARCCYFHPPCRTRFGLCSSATHAQSADAARARHSALPKAARRSGVPE